MRLHDEAVSSVGESKVLRARYAAQRLDDFDFAGNAGERIDALVRAIRGEGPGDAPQEDGPNDTWASGDPMQSYETERWGADEPPF